MWGITNLWAYVIGTVLVILLPGPNSLYVLSVAARRGVRDGYRAAAAVFIGDSVLMFLSAAGAATLLRTTPFLFTVVKYAAAGYLAFIGVQMLREAVRTWKRRKAGAADAPEAAAEPVASKERPFRRALIASLLNPKAILFFVSFFVQFVDPAYPYPAVTFLILAAIVQICSITYLSVLIFGGTALASLFRSRHRLASAGTATVGGVLIGFAARVATASAG